MILLQLRLFDIERLKARQQSAAALSELLNMGVGDLAQELGLPEGSSVKIFMHSSAGALVSLVAGGNAGYRTENSPSNLCKESN